MAVAIVFETHALTTDNEAGLATWSASGRQRVSRPFPDGESYRQVVDRVAEFLGELARDWDRARVLVVGHSATRWALDHLLAGAALHDLVVAPFAWQEGWSYALPAGWRRPGPGGRPGYP